MRESFRFDKPKTEVFIEEDGILFRRGKHDMNVHKIGRGDVKVYYRDIIDIKFHEPTVFSQGYLQFSTPRTDIIGVLATVDQKEKAVFFKKKKLKDAIELKKVVEERLNVFHNKANSSIADEIIKYKELLDTGAITEREFQNFKEKLLP